MPIKSQQLLNAPLAFWLAEMQNDIFLGEFIKANILTKKFNESLWSLVNKGLWWFEGIIEYIDP